MPSALKTNPREGISPLAGCPAPRELLIDPGRLGREDYVRRPDLGDAQQMVKFGTSGHRGSPMRGSFTEAHILAITQPICGYRAHHGPDGTQHYTRLVAPATPEQKAGLERLSPESVRESHLAGERITAALTRAPGNDAPIGGLKMVTASGWLAARPSGTENIYKIDAECFRGEDHLDSIVREAQEIVDRALRLPGASA